MLSYPIYMDTTGVFRRTNPQLPSNPMLHTFLLDENNEVLAVGNPLENEKNRPDVLENREGKVRN